MKNLLNSLQDRLESLVSPPSDPPRERRRKVTLVVVGLLSCATGLIVGTRGLVLAQPTSYVLLPYSFAAVVGSGVIIHFLTKKFTVLLHAFLFMILIVPTLFQWSVGGFIGIPGSVTIIFWSILAPVGSLMFQGVKKSVGWFSAYLALVLVSLYFDKEFSSLAIPISHSTFIVDQGINVVLLSMTLFLTMLYFVQAFQREHARAEKLVIDLTNASNNLRDTLGELQETQSELIQSEKQAALGKLAAGIAHEINNPIGALKSAVDSSSRCISKMEQSSEVGVRESRSDRAADTFKYFQVLRDNNQVLNSAADRIANTVKSFIDFARLDGGDFARVDVNDCVENAITMIKLEIGDEVDIVRELGDIPTIPCYPGELNQVFWNLLMNSAQAIEGKGAITVRTFVETEHLHVQVTDTGRGISPEKLQSLFEPNLSRGKTRVKAGLGLFTSYQIIQKHRGKIEVESEVGKGSIFTVILPLNLAVTSGNQ